jgi:small subunit ribosomal protein S16
MAVTLRMTRKGKKHRPFYHLIATDSRNKRDGAFLEQLGVYDPLGETFLAINEEAALKWLKVGAQTSATVLKLLKRAGIKFPVAKAATAATAA